ncbi:MAG: lytic transglycosylase domain-containing protein [Acidimicrobiaceae bacterium]|nr:lytic transglycosylase domain-containing protein [Acidimicrobiaceae bacterium]
MRPGRPSLAAIVVLTACSCSAAVKHQAAPPTYPTTDSPSTTGSPPATTTTLPALTTTSIRPATDPVGLAAELAGVEARLHSPGMHSGQLALQALRQQLAYEYLGAHPEWLPVVLTRVPALWRATVEANGNAAIDLHALSTPVTQAQLQGWRVSSPAAPAALLGDYKQGEAITGVPWQVLAAIHLVETKMSRLQGPSSAGAQGPMQFLPVTWASYGQGDIHNDRDAILAAARYLRAMGAPGDLAGAIYHYNPSQHYVRAVLAYAAQMRADPSAFAAYYHWQVVFFQGGHEVVLPEGYPGVPAIVAG